MTEEQLEKGLELLRKKKYLSSIVKNLYGGMEIFIGAGGVFRLDSYSDIHKISAKALINSLEEKIREIENEIEKL